MRASAHTWSPSVADLSGIGTLVAAFIMWIEPPNWEWGFPITVALIGLVIFAATGPLSTKELALELMKAKHGFR